MEGGFTSAGGFDGIDANTFAACRMCKCSWGAVLCDECRYRVENMQCIVES